MENKDESTGWKILKAGPKDLEEIAVLARRIWRAHYPGIITPEQIEYMLAGMFDLERMRRQLKEGVVYDRLLMDGQCIGFSAHGPLSGNGEYKLDKLYLLDTFRRRGLGSAMIHHLLEQAQATGAEAVVLNVNKRNRQAIEAYRRNGFRIRQSVVVDIGNNFVMDDYVMERRL